MTKALRAIPLLLLAFSLPRTAAAQDDTCDTHNLPELREEAAGKSWLLCQGVAYVAMGRVEEGRRILHRVVTQAPHGNAAFEAHERLLGSFARMGQVREAAREISALLAIRPNDTGVLGDSSMFKTFGQYADMTISHRQPVSFSKQQTDGSLNIPFTVNGGAATFYLDTGANFSVISDAEAHALGLTVTPVNTKTQDSGGTNISFQVADVEQLDIGPIRLMHVPFLVVPTANPPFNGLPLKNQGLLGIQVALALQTVRLETDGQLNLALPSKEDAKAEPLTFDDMFPVLHVTCMGKVLPFTLDTGATNTILNPLFAHDFPDVVAAGTKKDHDITGVGGTVTRRSVELPTWSVTLGSKTASIEKIPVLLEKANYGSEWALGNMGINILQKCKPFTIDFANMRLSTGP
jgi:predicted aspartyl protease